MVPLALPTAAWGWTLGCFIPRLFGEGSLGWLGCYGVTAIHIPLIRCLFTVDTSCTWPTATLEPSVLVCIATGRDQAPLATRARYRWIPGGSLLATPATTAPVPVPEAWLKVNAVSLPPLPVAPPLLESRIRV